MKTLSAFALFLVSFAALAQSPSFTIISDPLAAGVTHCGFFLDAGAKVVRPVIPDPDGSGGNVCEFDLSGVANGNHVLIATAIIPSTSNTTGGESDPSPPFDFVVTGKPNGPTGQRIRVK